MNSQQPTARNKGLINCHTCHLLCAVPPTKTRSALRCPRCGVSLRLRKNNSLNRTWALVLAALICYFPANILPITVTTSLGREQSDTIMSGVIHFIQTGSFLVAAIIFVASIFIPMMKILVLIFLLYSVQNRSSWRPRDRTRLYRLIQSVGRWSMVDIYVVTIVVALVRLGAFANVDAGPAAVYFAAVVIITIFAAESFDPRLIWDALEESDDVKRQP